MIALEHGRTMPAREHMRRDFYPWQQMAVGDSFVFPANVNHPYATAAAASRRHAPWHFSVRKTRDGFRCWRDR